MKIKKHTLFNIIAIIFFLFTIMPLTLAWFSEKHDVDVTDLTGSSVASYFGGGSGTQTDPFIIATPEHLYNLAWLQNRHVLEEMNWDYFILDPEGTSDVLDMAGALSGEGTKTGAIPPIGTKENPFRGYFDGNSCVIENLWVSTDPNDWQEQPEEYLNEDYSYGVGLFGYLEKHETNPTYVGNFYLRNIEVTCSIQTDNLGLVAGYVNCSMNRIGVENGIFTCKKNCQVKSVYSLIGDIDSEVIWTDNPTKGGSGANGDLVINPTVDTSCQVGSGSKMPVLGANPGTAYYIGSLTRKDPNPQPKSFMRFNNSISFNGSKITYTANTSTTSTVTQTNVEESFYNLTRENGTKYSIIPNGQPNFANAASYNTYPTNGVWFQPYAGGTCVISFARQNSESSISSIRSSTSLKAFF